MSSSLKRVFSSVFTLVLVIGLIIILFLTFYRFPFSGQGQNSASDISSGTFFSPVTFTTPTPPPGSKSTPEITNTPVIPTPSVLGLEITAVEKIGGGSYLTDVWSESPNGEMVLVSKDYHGHQLQQSPREDATGLEGRWATVFDLWAWNQKSGEERLLTKSAIYWSWSPDGSALAYLAPAGEQGMEGILYVLDLSGKSLEPRQIAKADIVLGLEQSVRWLSSNEIVYVFEGHIWGIQPDGSGTHQLNDLHLFQDSADEFKELAAYTGNVNKFYISPNGKRIAYTIIHDYWHYEAWMADLDGQNATLLADYALAGEWSPDSQKLTYYSEQYPNDKESFSLDTTVFDIGTESRYLIYKPSDAFSQPGDAIWSPNSEQFAFMEQPGNILWITTLDGKKQERFSDFERYDKNLASLQVSLMRWSSNSDYLLVRTISSEKSNFYKFNLATQK